MLKKILIIAGLISMIPASIAYGEEPATEVATEATTEPTTESTTEAVTEPVTEPTKSDQELLLNSGSAEGNSEKPPETQSAPQNVVKEEDIKTVPIVTDNSADIQDMEEEKKRLEEEQQKNQEAVDAKKEELASLNKELSEAMAKLNELDVKASELSTKMYETQQSLDKSNKEKDVQYGDMKKRIQYMYENGSDDLMSAIFSSQDMADAMNAASYYQQIYDYDRDKLQTFKETVERIDSLKKQQEEELAQTNALKEEADIERKKLEVFVAEKQGDIDALTRTITEGEQGIATLDQNILDALNRMSSEASARARYQGNTEALLKIAEAAQEEALKTGKANAKMVAVARNAGRGISTYPLDYGWCAAWVSGVYRITGGITPPSGNAIDYWNKWKSSGSTRMDNVPIGACVISSGDPTWGHIGIYLGGGIVASNLGYCKVETIESFGNVPAVCQGHRGYIGWVWPNGQSLM